MLRQTPYGHLLIREETVDGIDILHIPSIPYAEAGRFERPHLRPLVRGETDRIINRPMTPCFPQRVIPKWLNLFLKHHMMRPEFRTDHDELSEDAFVIHVWTPRLEGHRPVLVFLHGGGDYGSGSTPLYNGRHLAARGIVAVTVTYRVGIMGYLPVYDETGLNANRAAYDQQAALQFIRNHIEVFGGDPENITLMGHSGGALSALNQFLNPVSNRLFDKLILCGGPLPTAKQPADSKERFEAFLKKNKLRDSEELKQVPTAKLARLKSGGFLEDYIDGEFFACDPEDILKNGDLPDIPVLIGSNGDEFSMIEMRMFYRKMGIATHRKDLIKRLKTRYGTFAAPLYTAFRKESRNIIDLQIRILEALVFHSTAWTLLQTLSAKRPVYGYRMDYAPDIYQRKRGAYHGAELVYFFDSADQMHMKASETYRNRVRKLQGEWIQFLETGSLPGTPTFDDGQKIRHYSGISAETADFPHGKLIAKLAGSPLAKEMFDEFLKQR